MEEYLKYLHFDEMFHLKIKTLKRVKRFRVCDFNKRVGKCTLKSLRGAGTNSENQTG